MVINWRGEYQSQGGNGIASPPQNIHQEQSGVRPAMILFFQARVGNWNEFLVQLERVDPEDIRDACSPFVSSEPGENILHFVVSEPNVPLQVVDSILRVTADDESAQVGNSIVLAQNQRSQLPLHLAVMKNPTRSDVIQSLYDADPRTVNIRDDRQLRPIDEITATIIMMEEVLKYSKKDEKMEHNHTLKSLWLTAQVLVGAGTGIDDCATEGRTGDKATFLVHACIQSRQIPFSLTERAMKYKKEQLALPDVNGDFPLHIVARIPPQVAPLRYEGSSGDDDDESEHEDEESEHEDDEGDFIQHVLGLNPDAASAFNKDEQIPLVVAIQAGRLWRSGVFLLLSTHPVGIQELKLPTTIYPFLFERLADHPDIVYRILLSMPGVFVGPSTTSPIDTNGQSSQ